MAPQTRPRLRPATPECEITHIQYATPKKSAFFSEFDRNREVKPFTRLCAELEISTRTGYRWLEERRNIGTPACRRSRPKSQILGRKSRVSRSTLKFMVSDRNRFRDQSYECQIEKLDIPIKRRALRTQLSKHTNNAQRYKMAYTKKKLSPANLEKRVAFATEHENDTIEGFWHLVFFTDEAHIDPASCKTGCILREEGKRNAPENIQQKPKKEGNKLHWAGWVNWHAKCERLEFYHDEEEHIERPKRPRKPRKRKEESEGAFQERLKVWDATLPHPVEVKPKGNSMTQKYYVERLLPVYVSAINNASEREDLKWILMEDNDPSHGHRGPKPGVASLAETARQQTGIRIIIHPPQSPDLNPIEGCWLILKERIKQREWHTLDELKELLQEEWSKITMKEIRERIAEMPERCSTIKNSGGKPFKGEKW